MQKGRGGFFHIAPRSGWVRHPKLLPVLRKLNSDTDSTLFASVIDDMRMDWSRVAARMAGELGGASLLQSHPAS